VGSNLLDGQRSNLATCKVPIEASQLHRGYIGLGLATSLTRILMNKRLCHTKRLTNAQKLEQHGHENLCNVYDSCDAHKYLHINSADSEKPGICKSHPVWSATETTSDAVDLYLYGVPI